MILPPQVLLQVIFVVFYHETGIFRQAEQEFTSVSKNIPMLIYPWVFYNKSIGQVKTAQVSAVIWQKQPQFN
jgi:hypothetical protein